MSEDRPRFRIVREAGEVQRVCPGCLTPLVWYEFLVPRKKSDPRGPQSTDEQARCPTHGPVDWWRLMSTDSGRVLGFSTHLRGGRLYARPITRERALAHAARPLIHLHARRGRPGNGSIQRMSRDDFRKLRNRFRGFAVLDDRQGRLFLGGGRTW